MATGVSYHFAWLLLVLVSLSSGERSRAVRERGRNSGSADRLQKEFKRLKRDLQRLTTRVNSLVNILPKSIMYQCNGPRAI